MKFYPEEFDISTTHGLGSKTLKLYAFRENNGTILWNIIRRMKRWVLTAVWARYSPGRIQLRRREMPYKRFEREGGGCLKRLSNAWNPATSSRRQSVEIPTPVKARVAAPHVSVHPRNRQTEQY